MKNSILILIIALTGLISAKAEAGATINKATALSINTPDPRKTGTDKSMRRMRSKVFTVNVLSFNKKIRVKHDKQQKALADAARRQAKKSLRGNKNKTLVAQASI
jgi:hypothetical protein